MAADDAKFDVGSWMELVFSTISGWTLSESTGLDVGMSGVRCAELPQAVTSRKKMVNSPKLDAFTEFCALLVTTDTSLPSRFI